MNAILPISYVESGRIYIEPLHRNIFLIKCQYCLANFSAWPDFWHHIKSHAKLTPNDDHENIKATIKGECFDDEYEGIESPADDELEEETEMVLIADKENCQSLEGSEEEFSQINENDFYIDDIESNSPGNTDDDSSDFQQGEYKTSEKALGKRKPVAHTKQSKTNLERRNKSHSDTLQDFIASTSSSSCLEASANSRIVFNVRSSDPHKALCLIQIIKNFSSLWNVNDPNYGIRSKQQEDYKQVAKLLDDKYNIKSTINEIRLSFSDMRSWYQRESKALDKYPHRAVTHPKCYEALDRFLFGVLQNHIQCTECAASFKKDSQLATHRYKFHHGPMPFKCDYCSQSFAYQSQKRHHENRHTLGVSFPCQQCEYKAPNQADLKLHMAKHSDLKPYICDVCGSSYKKSTSLNIHKRTHGKPYHKCSCGKVFYETYRYKVHLASHKDVSCSICSMKFPSKKLLSNHLLDHMADEKQLELKMKKSVRTTMLRSKKEEQQVEEEEEALADEDYEGDSIEYLFSDNEDTILDNAKSYFANELSCLYCYSDFLTSEDLITHLREAHEENG